MKNKIAAVAIILVMAIVSIINFKIKPDEAYMVVFGDSLIGNDRTEESVPGILEEALGLRVFNGGFGGSTLGKGNDTDHVGNRANFFSLLSLSWEVRKNNFKDTIISVQKNKTSEPEYFYETAEGLNNIDFKKVSYIVIEEGVNDYFAGSRIDDEEDPYNEDTFLGALRTSVKNIKKGAKEAEIIVITPCYNNIYGDGERDCNTVDYGGGVLEDYVNAEIRCCEEEGIDVIDDFHDSLINEDTYEEYLYDGLHTNSKGNRVIADKIWNYICLKNQ